MLDTKDERSIKNTLAAAEKKEKDDAAREAQPEPLPTAAATAHGNEPSRGAKIDEQVRPPPPRPSLRPFRYDSSLTLTLPSSLLQIMIEEEIELANKAAKGN